MIYVYSLDQENVKKYIGLTKNPSVRKNYHRRKKPAHVFNILEIYENITDAGNRERELIKEYNTVHNGWNISPGGEYVKFSGYNRKGIGGVKKGTIPWNKGKKNCFSDETIKRFREKRKGIRYNKHTKVTRELVDEIRKIYASHDIIDGVGTVQKNGVVLTQARAFSNLYHKNYKITAVNLYNIITNKSWKNVNQHQNIKS
jgi:hypothetical protein